MYRSGISGFFDVSLFPPNVNSSPVLEETELQHNTVTVVPLTEHLLCARYHARSFPCTLHTRSNLGWVELRSWKGLVVIILPFSEKAEP